MVVDRVLLAGDPLRLCVFQDPDGVQMALRRLPASNRYPYPHIGAILMREKPTLRIPLGILLLMVALGIYALAVMWGSRWIGALPVLLQALIYLVLGVAWLLVLPLLF